MILARKGSLTRSKQSGYFYAGLMASTALLALGGLTTAQAQTPNTTSPAPAGAAEPTPVPKTLEKTEEVTVTGSRIRGVAPTGSTLIGLSPKDLQNVGAVNVTDALQEVPQISNLGVSDSSRISPGGAGNIGYASGINIRGIGPYATLTLFDGHRLVQSGPSGGLPDPNDIPLLMLNRIELIPDGASAIYGSDAVAGVANLIPKRNADDVELLARYGVADNYEEHVVDAEFAHKWDTGQFTLVIEDNQHDALNGQHRDFYGADLTSRGGNDYRSPECSPANIMLGATTYALPGLQPNTTNLCDVGKTQDLIPAQEHNNLALTFDQKITDWLAVFGDGLLSQRFFAFQTGTPNGILTVPRSNPYYIAPAGTNPASEQVETSFTDTPPQGSDGRERLDQFTGGFTVNLPYEFRLTTDFTYGEDTGFSSQTTGLNNAALAAALNSTNPRTALNPYGVGASNNRALASQLFNEIFYAPGTNRLQEGELKLDGPIYKLPAGDARIALGTEYDYQSLHDGLTSGTPGQVFNSRTLVTQQVHALYGELYLPVFGDANALPFLRKVDIDVAGRYENYNNIGSTTNPKVGVNWSPVEGLTLHGSYGTSFRAPSLSSVHGALNGLFVQPYATPNGVVEGVALSGLAQGNPLHPETAKTFSAGADYRPPFYPDLKLSLNYFNIDYEGQISQYLSDLTLLSSPSRQAEFSSIIRTGAAAQAAIKQFVSAGYPIFGVLPSDPQYFIYGENINLGKTKADGLDIAESLRIPTDKYGTFNIGVTGEYFLDYLVAVTPTSPLMNQANNIFNPLRFHMRDSIEWRLGNLDSIVFINYENAYNNTTVTPVQRISALTTVDLHLSYNLGERYPQSWLKGVTVSLDVQNLFDSDPPFVNIAENANGGGGYDPTVTNPIGRLVAFTLDKRF
jgi:iron complex outermembrane receptor protein